MTDEHRSEQEKLLTMKAAAKALGLHYWAIQRAVRRGAIPSYRPFNSRPLVKLSDIEAAIEASKAGGAA